MCENEEDAEALSKTSSAVHEEVTTAAWSSIGDNAWLFALGRKSAK
jgi:hypothetical protein